ncbi:dihydrolipoamide acetyltransferase family protein [Amycolatopsis sp. NPDC059657]|uniref:dihydrolipoamide acetyltransferase family protein n=1 Tax=Amycolatopsis sp. NPDC059657 TaxID=3346899 RepID=UPI00366AF71F
MGEFLMPSLGADMDEGTIIEWLVKPGDQVRKGDVVAVVDTAKAAIEVETFTAGEVTEILVPQGEKVPVGTPLARIGTSSPPGDPTPAAEVSTHPQRPSPPEPPKRPPASPPVRTFAAHAGVDLTRVRGTGRDGSITHADVQRAMAVGSRAKVTPYARRLAGELGVDLSTLHGETIRARDVRAAAGKAEPVKAESVKEARKPDDGMRQAIAALMARSKREIPHYYLSTTIDLSAATGWLRERNRSLPVPERIVPAALLLKATALAAGKVPQLNGHWVDGRFRPADGVHLAVAVSLRGGGLVAPAMPDTDKLPLDEIMRRLRDLVSRARAGRLRSSEMTMPTMTVTNLGDLGVESVQGVIYPPQVALVGFGAVMDRPWAVDGLLGVRPLVTATLAADHRATDGAIGARFLSTIDTLLRRPEEL